MMDSGPSVIGSIAELKEMSDNCPDDIELHRPYIDEITFPCPKCGKTMKRVPEVIDCWFDSGAMPFAQHHYPFENKELFEQQFPAQFISEAVDQTRGWFYSLMAISTFIKGKAPYKNVLVNDLVLDKEGKKMSKHKGNTVDPFNLFDKYGADATRWYLLSVSPVWLPTKFDEDGLKDVQGKFFGTLRNVYNFFVLYANTDDIDAKECFVPYEKRPELDCWILSRYSRTLKDATAAMEDYDHNSFVKIVSDFVQEDLSNWYIRRARRRFYAEVMDEDKKAVYATTYEILVGLARMIAPVAPFISDEMYINLTGEESVHLASYPKAEESLLDADLEERMDLVRKIVTMGRGVREKTRIKVRQPLSELLVDGAYEEKIGYMADLIREELNVKKIRFEHEMDSYISYTLKPDFRAAGPVLGSKIKAFGAAIAKLDPKEALAKLAKGSLKLNLNGEDTEITENMVSSSVTAKEGFDVALENGVCVILDTQITEDLVEEGLARELISKIQQMRKAKDFEMMDRIKIRLCADDAVRAAAESFADYIMSETLADSIEAKEGLEICDINGHKTGIDVERVQ